MSLTRASSFKTIRSIGDLDRFDVVVDPSAWIDPPERADRENGRIDWDEIERAIREILGRMVHWVRQRCPEFRSRPGRTSGRSFALFAYRDFERMEGDEALVVGINFEVTSDGGSIQISGDICEEETGHIVYEAPMREVPAGQPELLAAADRAAGLLAAQTDLVSKWLCDPSAGSRSE